MSSYDTLLCLIRVIPRDPSNISENRCKRASTMICFFPVIFPIWSTCEYIPVLYSLARNFCIFICVIVFLSHGSLFILVTDILVNQCRKEKHNYVSTNDITAFRNPGKSSDTWSKTLIKVMKDWHITFLITPLNQDKVEWIPICLWRYYWLPSSYTQNHKTSKLWNGDENWT